MIDKYVCVECGWSGFKIFEIGVAPSCPKCRGNYVDVILKEVKIDNESNEERVETSPN